MPKGVGYKGDRRKNRAQDPGGLTAGERADQRADIGSKRGDLVNFLANLETKRFKELRRGRRGRVRGGKNIR